MTCKLGLIKGKTWREGATLLELSTLKNRSRFYLLSSLLLLLIGTIVSWQFRFVESDSIYWRDRPLDELISWRRHENALPPKIITSDNGDQILEFTPQKQHQIISINSWQATGAEKIKVRLRHRSVDKIKPSPEQQTDPISISVTGIDENNHLILDRVGHIVAANTTETWKASEAVMPLSEKARRFDFAIVIAGESGSLQISDLDIVGVQKASWFTAVSLIIWILWAIWIFKALRRFQHSFLICLLSALWILGWSGYLVFPRTIDIPRPFSSQFWVPTNDAAVHKAALVLNPTKARKSGPAPKANQPPTDNARKWFKSFGGGRFLMHFGIMGVFAGGLLLLIPLQSAWPYIFTMVVGIELVPAILIHNANGKDLLDLLAYCLAIAAAIPIASIVKSRISIILRREIKPSAQSSQRPS